MIKIGSTEVNFPYSKIMVGEDKVYPSGGATIVNYIEGTGHQCISPSNLSIPLTSRKWEIKFQLTDLTLGDNGTILGSLSGTSRYPMLNQLYTTGGNRIYSFRSDSETINITPTPDTNQHTILVDFDNQTIKYDNETPQSYTFPPTNQNILACASQTTALYVNGRYAKAKIYYFKVYDNNNTLLYNFLPAIDENNKVCLYDSTSDLYLYNASTYTDLTYPLIYG